MILGDNMNNRVLGILCMLGAAVKLIPALLSTIFPGNATIQSLDYLSGAIGFPLLIAGPLALFLIRAYGSGSPAKLGLAGFVVTIFGLALYVINIYILNNIAGFSPIRAGIAAISTAVGMTILGFAIMFAKQLPGWYRYAVLGVGVTYFIQVIFQSIFRLSQGLAPLGGLLAIWWLAWLLLGYAIFRQKNFERKITITPIQ